MPTTLDSSPSATAHIVCLQGFPNDETEKITHWLKARGRSVVRTMSTAQLVVAGSLATDALADRARKNNLPLLPWSEYESLILAETTTHTASQHTAPGSYLADPPTAAPQPLVEYDEAYVRVLDLVFPNTLASTPDARLVPCASRFAHLCFDQPFADTLRAVGLGVLNQMPVALEGETSASKTTAVLWLAHLLGQPVVRFNLNGQTDTGELVGRYVPNDSHGSNSNWRFKQGYLPNALRNGWWLLLDEMNLAEPQILERLNSVLEQPTSLVLTEGDGTVFGQNGDVPIAEAFRIFATLNPAEYSGRSILSPAFRDRWSIWHQAQTAGERQYHAMLRLLVLGQQPIVHARGTAYQADPSAPLYPRLQDLPEAEHTLQRLAQFHTSVVKAAGTEGDGPSLGRTQRERYTFTRRTLLNTLHFAHNTLNRHPTASPTDALREAIQTFYIARLRSPSDQKAVKAQLRLVALD